MENLDFLKCYYRPSFFRIKIDVPVNLENLSELTDATFALYFHEYIHFIQDISTIYGLINISTITYYIHDAAHHIPKSNDNSFETPIYLQNNKDDYGYNNFKLRPYYIGSSINPKHKNVEIISYKKKLIQWGNADQLLEIIEVDGLNKDSNEKLTFNLGGNHITEGMAYLCEQYVYYEILNQQNQYLPADDYPYLIVYKLVELIYPDLANEPLLVIAACDSCLMTYHPGLSFIRLIEHLKKINFLDSVKEIRQLYTEANNLLKGNHVDLEVLLKEVKLQIKQSFNSEYFEGNNQWIETIFDRIKIFREDIPEFVTDFLQFGNLKQNKFFGMFHKFFGSPLLVNSEDEGTFNLPDSFNSDNFHPSLFWAINQILRVFSSNKPIPCELKRFCENSQKQDGKLIVDERCDTEPWSRCSDKDLCPFATIWRHWSLCGYTPKSLNEKQPV